MEERWAWAGAVAALLAPATAALANWWSRKGAQEQREGDWREKGQQTLFQQQGTQLEATYQRIKELEAEVGRIEADRDRGWGLARAWFDRAHDERHRHVNTLQVARALLDGDGPKLGDRTPAPLPGFLAMAPKDAP